MDSIMERQESLKLNVPESVTVIGCGGVGSWVAYFLALAGVPELWLFDMDTISEHNLNRIPLPLSSVGKRKTDAIAELIATVRPKCSVISMGWFTEEIANGSDLAANTRWIVATTDTLASRQLISKWAAKIGMRYIEAAAEGEYGSCTGQPAEWSTPQEAMPGYQSVPVWVGPCIFAAGIAVAHILHGQEMGDRAIRMGWEKKGKYDQAFVMYDSTVEPEEELEEDEQTKSADASPEKEVTF